MRIEHDELVKYVKYDPISGDFIRLKNSARGKAKAGDKAGSRTKSGYIEFWVCGEKFLAHRLAWFYMTGDWPKEQIDHINGIRSDNRFCNLRAVSNGENQQNIARPKSHNSSGYLGVSRNRKRWKAEIRVDGHRIHIGTYDTKQEASEAYMSKKRDVHQCNRYD